MVLPKGSEGDCLTKNQTNRGICWKKSGSISVREHKLLSLCHQWLFLSGSVTLLLFKKFSSLSL